MSEKIDVTERICSVNLVTEGRFVNVTVPENSGTVVELHKLLNLPTVDTDRVLCNTLMSAIEHSLASDFTEFYDKFDATLGVVSGTLEKCQVSFSTLTQKTYNKGEFSSDVYTKQCCIRQVNLSQVRSFITGKDVDYSNTGIGRDMTEMSMNISDKGWIYLQSAVSNVLGYDFVSVDLNLRHLGFNYKEGKSRRTAEGVYLLLSEIVSLGEARVNPLFVLVSELPQESDVQERLLQALQSIRYSCQVFVL